MKLKCGDVEKLLFDLSFTHHILNELYIIISKLLRLLRPKFETTQRNLCFKKCTLQGYLSPISKMPDHTHANSHARTPKSFWKFWTWVCFLLVKQRHQLKWLRHSGSSQTCFAQSDCVQQHLSHEMLLLLCLFPSAVGWTGSSSWLCRAKKPRSGFGVFSGDRAGRGLPAACAAACPLILQPLDL